MSRSYRRPYEAVTGTAPAAYDKRLAARGVRRAQNQWVRTTFDFEEAIVPHTLECSWNNVWNWKRDGKQRLQVPDARDWSRYCLEKNGLHPYCAWDGEKTAGPWPPRWFARLLRK